MPSFSYAPLCRRVFECKPCVYTPMSDLGQPGSDDYHPALLQQPDLAALGEPHYTRVQQSAFNDEAAIILSGTQAATARPDTRAMRAGQPRASCEDGNRARPRSVLTLSRPDALHCDHETFMTHGRSLSRSGIYRPPFRYYSLLPAGGADGRISPRRVANFCVVTTGHGAKVPAAPPRNFAGSSPWSPSRFRTRSTASIDLLCTGATTFASWWRSPARSSSVWISTSWSARWRDHRCWIDAISVVLRSSNRREAQHLFHHYLDASHPVLTRARWMKPAPHERVFKAKMLLLNLHEHDTLAPYEKMLFG